MHTPKRRLTLVGLFFATILGITLLVAGLFIAFLSSSRRSMLESAQLERESAALRVEASIWAELSRTERAAEDIELAIRYGAGDVSSDQSIEPLLFMELLQRPELVEIELTQTETPIAHGTDPIEPDTRQPWQVAVFRTSRGPESTIFTRRIAFEHGHFVRALRMRPVGGDLQSGTFRPLGITAEPHVRRPLDTAGTPSSSGVRFGDLTYAETDAPDPVTGRQVVLDAEKPLVDATGASRGMIRVSLSTRALDDIANAKVDPRDPGDPHHVFICDTSGRLITRLSPDDTFVDVGGSLRAYPTNLPPAVTTALHRPLLSTLDENHRNGSETIRIDGRPYLVTLHRLRRPEDWVVGIVVPEDYYVHELEKLRYRFLVSYGGISLLVLVCGLFALRAVRRGFNLVLETTTRMRNFDFSPSFGGTAFADVEEVIDGLERAKTAARTMGKYLPLDVVRQLYEANREPVLSSQPREMTLMFSDIRGFTRLSEQLPPEELARVLGLYFEAMTSAIMKTGGTIDKFIGDSIMALWNAPGACVDHPAAACRAVLACLDAARQLYTSPGWKGRDPLYTRFGVHTGRALVGHFGAPMRLSYSAMGDAVNLAARLESLCKQYGVEVLVSDAVHSLVEGQYVFRLVDSVTVVGKTEAIRVYELLGAVGEEIPRLRAARAYEDAFDVYLRRDFASARALFEQCGEDPPSVVLAERCARYAKEPPPRDWDGTFHAELK
jgi:adenylate cyclase